MLLFIPQTGLTWILATIVNMKHISVPLCLIKARGHLIKSGLRAYDGHPGEGMYCYIFTVSDLKQNHRTGFNTEV